jgi:hypothetical protein
MTEIKSNLFAFAACAYLGLLWFLRCRLPLGKPRPTRLERSPFGTHPAPIVVWDR